MKRRDVLGGMVLGATFGPALAWGGQAKTEAGGWRAGSARDEIRPEFSFDPKGGPDGQGGLVIRADAREGLHGWWSRAFPVQGGRVYRFRALRRAENVPVPRRSVMVRLLWQDAQGKPVPSEEPVSTQYLRNWRNPPLAEPEFPRDGTADARGWTEVASTYRAPSEAARALVELHLQWAPGGRVEWGGVSLAETASLPSRKVRLAAVHLRPEAGKTPDGNRRQFAPLIEAAARQRADLVVLPETLTYIGTGRKFHEVAEPIPGPSTAYFGELARQHNLYVIAGLVERAGHLVHNVAVLIGPDGSVAGKFRKVCLPQPEVAAGIAPGDDYPVFETRFGKVGMMVCYDGFFPEVAHELANRGAEVIAWPVWGGNPELAVARAAENQVYLVSSTYADVSTNWGKTAVYNQAGEIISQAKEWGTLALAEVDLDRPLYWRGPGNFKDALPRHRPVALAEPTSR